MVKVCLSTHRYSAHGQDFYSKLTNHVSSRAARSARCERPYQFRKNNLIILQKKYFTERSRAEARNLQICGRLPLIREEVSLPIKHQLNVRQYLSGKDIKQERDL